MKYNCRCVSHELFFRFGPKTTLFLSNINLLVVPSYHKTKFNLPLVYLITLILLLMLQLSLRFFK